MSDSYYLLDAKKPCNSIYFKASFVLRVLYVESSIDLIYLFQKTRELEEISFKMFYLCLLWLYMLDLIYLGDNFIICLSLL
jgi:hypothetical protein